MRQEMRLEPTYNNSNFMQFLPDSWAVASVLTFDAVLGRFLLVGVVAGGLVFLWHCGKDLPKNTDLERGLAYFVMLGVCALGAITLKLLINLDATWSWVAFLSAGAAACAGLASGYKTIDEENEVKNPGARKPRATQSATVFLITAAVAFLIFKGYFFILWMLGR